MNITPKPEGLPGNWDPSQSLKKKFSFLKASVVPRPFDLVSTVLYLSVVISYVYTEFFSPEHPYNRPWNTLLALGGLILILVAIDRVEFIVYGNAPPPPRVAWGLLLLRMVLIELVVELEGFNLSIVLYSIVPYIAALYFSPKTSYSLGLVTWLFAFARTVLSEQDWYAEPGKIHNLVVIAVALVFAITMALVVVKEKASRTRAELLLAELEQSHQQIRELATAEERNRLARDIHDSLGHYLTVINIQLEKGIALQSRAPEEAVSSFRHAKRLASEALQDVRDSVLTLRSSKEIFSLTASLQKMINNLKDCACEVELAIEGSEEDFSKKALLAIYRAAQEGLTNVQKHAAATEVSLKLRLNQQGAVLVLRDNGKGFDLNSQQVSGENNGGGYGLLGVQERLELVGGTLQIESVPGSGTILRVEVPPAPVKATKKKLLRLLEI